MDVASFIKFKQWKEKICRGKDPPSSSQDLDKDKITFTKEKRGVS